MLASLLLVFREVLEAALIVSIVAAATRAVPKRSHWIIAGIAVGIAGAILVAIIAGKMADSLDGMGQEWFNAGVLLTAVVMIGWHVVWMAKHGRELAMHMKTVGTAVSSGERPLTALMVVVALAVLREGSEIVLFGYGLLAGGSDSGSLLLGGGLGLLSGVLVGFGLYLGLLKIPMRYFFSATNGLLILLAAGLASSSANYLVQAGAIERMTAVLWDTSWLLGDDSMLGQTLHVLVGYESQPMGIQVVFYLVTVILLITGMNLVSKTPVKPASARA